MAGRKTRKRTHAIAKRYAFHANAKKKLGNELEKTNKQTNKAKQLNKKSNIK